VQNIWFIFLSPDSNFQIYGILEAQKGEETSTGKYRDLSGIKKWQNHTN